MTKSELVEFMNRDIKEMRDRKDELPKNGARWERLTAGIMAAQRYRLLIKNIEPDPISWPWRVRYDNE